MFNISWNLSAHLRFWLLRLKPVCLRWGPVGNGSHGALRGRVSSPGCLSVRLTLLPSKENYLHHLQANCSRFQITAASGSVCACSQPLTPGEDKLLYKLRDRHNATESGLDPSRCYFCNKHLWNRKVWKGSLTKSHRSMFLVLRITSKPHGLSLSRRNGTVPDRKVPQARQSMSHHGAETPVPQC